MFLALLSFLVQVLTALLCVAFFTLLERKVLGYIQLRKGPNKVSILGLPQPLADALKLATKEASKPLISNQSPYFLAPVFGLFLAVLLWQLVVGLVGSFNFSNGILFFLCVSSLSVYSTLVAGWASNSKYALLGAIRAVAQTISYEVSMALIMISAILFLKSFDLYSMEENQNKVWVVFLLWQMMFVWVVSTMAETNRAPFDFAEGESEIVSGFNIEYSSGGFALIFMAEYMNIIFMSLLTAVLFTGGSHFLVVSSYFFLLLKTMFFMFCFLWARGSLPRFRYDQLMELTWKGFLPFILVWLMVLVCLVFVV